MNKLEANPIKPVDLMLKDTPPNRDKYPDDLSWMCACLKDTIFISPTQKHLIPISQYDIDGGLTRRLYHAWNDPVLREGYLPTLPKEYSDIAALVKSWSEAPHKVVYYFPEDHLSNPICFIHTHYTEDENQLKIWVSGGNIRTDLQRKGHMTQAAKLLIEGLKTELPCYGYENVIAQTSVSDRNNGSMRVLEKNGFDYDPEKEIKPSPSLMGGDSFHVRLTL
jgi:RimJ/RimL family protein N-acetyltransferase